MLKKISSKIEDILEITALLIILLLLRYDSCKTRRKRQKEWKKLRKNQR